MNSIQAAFKILQGAGGPLHYQEITKRILAANLWKSQGKTPEATINARLAVDIKKKGAASAFLRTGSGTYTITSKRAAARPRRVDVLRSEDRTLYMSHLATGEKLSFTDAAERILDAVNGAPMHYREITRNALEHRMLDTSGKTPEATMYAQILTENKRRQRRGEQPRFMVLGKSMISSAKWQAKGLSFQVEEANRKVRKELLKSLKAMNPGEFEERIALLLATIGFDEVEFTSRSKDGGIDVRGTLVVGDVIRTRLAVQAKRWKHNIQSPVIQQVRGSLGAHEQGLIITTSDFSKGAKQEAERANTTPVGLLNGEQLVDLLVENDIGIRKMPLQLIQLDENCGSPDAVD